MSKDYGLTAKNPKGISFNGGNRHMMLDLNADPKHFDLVKLLGTAITVGAGVTTSEQLFKINHNLGYVPYVEIYFYPAGNAVANLGPFSLIDNTGSYSKNLYYYQVGGGVEDKLYMQVTDRSLFIHHSYYSAAGGTSTANTQPVWAKYYIFSNIGYDPTSKYSLQTVD
jgi:hypothetical protein